MILGLWWISLKTPLPPRARVAANALGLMAVLQVGTLNCKTTCNKCYEQCFVFFSQLFCCIPFLYSSLFYETHWNWTGKEYTSCSVYNADIWQQDLADESMIRLVG